MFFRWQSLLQVLTLSVKAGRAALQPMINTLKSNIYKKGLP